MKPLLAFATILIGIGSATAQSDRPVDSGALHQTEFPDPRGNLVVRWGQPPGRPAEARPSFDALDTNRNGAIDESEASAYLTLANDFDYADTNHDRRVSRREFDRW